MKCIRLDICTSPSTEKTSFSNNVAYAMSVSRKNPDGKHGEGESVSVFNKSLAVDIHVGGYGGPSLR